MLVLYFHNSFYNSFHNSQVHEKCGGLNFTCLQKGGGPTEVKKLFVGGTKKRGPDFFEICVVRPVVNGQCGGLNLSCLQKGGGPMEVKKLFVGGTKKGVQNFFMDVVVV